MTDTSQKTQAFLFHGEDTFTSRKKCNVWQKAFKEKHGHNTIASIDVEAWTGSEDELLGTCKKMITQQSLFHAAALVVIKNMFSSKAYRDSLGAFLLEHIPLLHQDTFVLMMEGGIDKRLSLYKSFCALEKKNSIRIETFDIPHGAALSKWVDSSLIELHASMTKEARTVFLNRFDPPQVSRFASEQEHYDLWLLWNELGKLAAYASARAITHHDIALLCPQPSHAHIFESMGVFIQKDTGKTLKCIYEILKQEHLHDTSSVLGICSFFQNQLHAMLVIKDMLARALSEQHSATALNWKIERIRIVSRQVKPLSLDFLKTAALAFIQLERLLKSRPIPAGSALLHTIERSLNKI